MCAWPTRRSRRSTSPRRIRERQVVFFAIGFETTTPATAHLILEARRLGLRNFSVYCNHVVTPAAIQSILDSPEVREWGQVRVDGFIGPSHVSAVIGSRPYEYFAEEYQRPVVIAGFEPLDVMQAIRMLVQQLNDGRACVENQFTRGVTRDGNGKAQRLVAEVLELRPSFEWRGLGELPYSGLRIKSSYGEFDAERRFAMEVAAGAGERGLPVPGDHPRRQEAHRLRDLRHRMHAAQSHRLVHGVRGRRLRRLLQVSPRHGAGGRLMRILLLVHSFNSLSQRLYVELDPRWSRAVGRAGHPRSRHQRGGRAVQAGSDSGAVSEARDSAIALAAASLSHRASGAARRSRPVGARLGDSARRGPLGSHGAAGGGASSTPGRSGPAHRFPCARARKSSLYRNEVTEGGVIAVRAALARVAAGCGPLSGGDREPAARLAAAAAAGAARDRLEPRRHRNRAAQDPFRRRLSGRRRSPVRSPLPTVRRAAGNAPGRPAGRDHRPPPRCHLPRDAGRCGVDRSAAAGGRVAAQLQASRRAGAGRSRGYLAAHR